MYPDVGHGLEILGSVVEAYFTPPPMGDPGEVTVRDVLRLDCHCKPPQTMNKNGEMEPVCRDGDSCRHAVIAMMKAMREKGWFRDQVHPMVFDGRPVFDAVAYADHPEELFDELWDEADPGFLIIRADGYFEAPRQR